MKEIATLIEMEYRGFGLANFKAGTRVFVLKGHEHPDPFKKLTFGYTYDGEVVSDYNAKFAKVGTGPILVHVEVPAKLTACAAVKTKIQAVYKKLAELKQTASTGMTCGYCQKPIYSHESHFKDNSPQKVDVHESCWYNRWGYID